METTKNIKTFIAKLEFFKNLSNPELEILSGLLESRNYSENETIFSEGDNEEDIYIIKSGTVTVHKIDGEQNHIVNQLGENDCFGEMSFLDSSPRSTTLRAGLDVTLYILKKQELVQTANSEEFLTKMYRNIAIENSGRLRLSTTNYAQSIGNELELQKHRAYFNQFIITILATYSITLVVTSLIHGFLKHINVYDEWFTWLYLVMVVAPFIYFVYKSEEPLAFFGVTFNNWKRVVFEGLLISLACMTGIYALLHLAGSFGFMPKMDASLFDIILGIIISPTSIFYLMHSYGQEFVARGVLQNSLQLAFDDKKGFLSIFITSWIFGLSHILYGPELVLVTVFSGFFFGLIFLRHNNLLGVSIVHFFMGGFAFALSQLPFAAKLM